MDLSNKKKAVFYGSVENPPMSLREQEQVDKAKF